MKRLILMGGRPWVSGDEGKHFTNTLFRSFEKSVKIAFCIFAQPESDWENTRQWNVSMFDKHKGNRTIDYQTMTPETLPDVSKWADIIYIPGGETAMLVQKLENHDLRQIWDNKVIAGSSAGADLFCKGYAYLQDKTFGRGLGWIPATCIPHWRDQFENYTDNDWDWAEQESLRQFPDLPVLCIPEGQIVEFTVV